MTSTFRLSLRLVLLALIGSLCWPLSASAQGGAITLSVSPTLFNMAAEPGQVLQSSLRIINVNDFDLTVYVDVVNFAPRGESGDGRFMPISETEGDGQSIAEWFTISSDPVVIPREQSRQVPFTVIVPPDAPPGGRSAAILVGTRPLSGGNSLQLQTAQTVTTLFFARVAGEVIESGLVREFTTEANWLGRPEANFTLRFENRGNVHLQPQGQVKILNMWGQERGIIPINQQSQFGNVLPESIRKYSYTWRGDWSPSDIGRYTAQVSLAYGTEAKQFASAEVTFWVIPFKLFGWATFSLVAFVLIMSWLVRLYVRRMLKLAGVELTSAKSTPTHELVLPKRRPSLKAPIQAGLLDLSRGWQAGAGLKQKAVQLYRFLWQYRLFFLGLGLTLLFMVALIYFIAGARTDYRTFEIIYNDIDSSATVSSEDIIYNQLRARSAEPLVEPDGTLPTVVIVNRSNVPGRAAELKLYLESLGYRVSDLKADFSTTNAKTVIISRTEFEAARIVSELLDNALVSPAEPEPNQPELEILLGAEVEW